MNPYLDPGWVFTLLELLAALFVFVLGVVVLAIIVIYVLEVSQTKQALRRNYRGCPEFCVNGDSFNAEAFCPRTGW